VGRLTWKSASIWINALKVLCFKGRAEDDSYQGTASAVP
jgi:hypothetical protein